MKKLGLLVREVSENRIKNNLKGLGSVLVIKHSGLSSPDLTTLRQSLKNTRATFFVVKNSLARRALKDAGLEEAIKLIEEPCGLVFVKEEPVDICRILYNFAKEHEQLKLAGGLLENKILSQKDIQTLARLPAKEVLRTQLVMVLNSPIVKLAMVLKQTLKKFVYCLEQIKNKKGS